MANGELVLVIAPLGGDAALIAGVLDQAGVKTVACADVAEACRQLNDSAGALVLTEEAIALTRDGAALLAEQLQQQPPWSDLPVIVLAREQTRTELSSLGQVYPGSSVTLLEKPLRRATLVSTVQMALRARRRQFEIRSLLEREKSARQQLEQAVQQLETFAYSVSHDLRAPLRSIGAFSAILAEELPQESMPAEAWRHLTLIRTNARQMDELISDLLAFSRAQRVALEKQPVDLNDLVHQVLGQIRSQEPDRRVQVCVAELPICQGDPTMLKQLLLNLLSNAFKFTSKSSAPRVEIGTTVQNGERVFYVRDNGVGFSPKYAHKLFRVFERLHSQEEFSGTGIGLAIVHQVVTRHGGRIWAESQEGQGATFFFVLPDCAKRA